MKVKLVSRQTNENTEHLVHILKSQPSEASSHSQILSLRPRRTNNCCKRRKTRKCVFQFVGLFSAESTFVVPTKTTRTAEKLENEDPSQSSEAQVIRSGREGTHAAVALKMSLRPADVI